MTFAAHAGLQSLTSQDIVDHPYRGEIDYRARLQMCVVFNSFFFEHSFILRSEQGQAGYDAAVEFDNNLRDKPFDLLHETIHCHDKTLGKIVECTVVDCGTSVLSGDYFVLQDGQGRKKQVTADELHEMRVS